MIFIDLFRNPPPQELIAEGEELTRQLMVLPQISEMILSINMRIIGED